MNKKLIRYKKELENRKPEEVLSWALSEFGKKKIALASSLGAEDQVLTDMILNINPASRIFTLDTGRLFQETYDAMQETMDKFKMKYEVYGPETKNIEDMIQKHGPNLFYDSVEKRKLCCEIRKIRPLKRVLSTVNAWICGLRQGQSVTREEIEIIEWDKNFSVFKINPLRKWSEEDVWRYIKRKDVPYNKLHDRSFPSIGCTPCTRAVKKGEDVRVGRWWWETPEQKECGLHCVNGKMVRKKSNG